MTQTSIEILTRDEAELRKVGATLAHACLPGTIVFLEGELGAGKTTLVRGFLNALGHQDSVKSPTYALVEPYHLPKHDIFHFDLYRLHKPETLEEIGIRDYMTPTAIFLIEWPDRGVGKLPTSDLICQIEFDTVGRKIFIQATTPKGQTVLQQIELHKPNFSKKI
ncbi:MAG: tRNA (adenosine(37)-N6)-threonylcarbamoyltransferase complex ATPase subunit type 1 TsaE [Gammaproteobacteria bacterium]